MMNPKIENFLESVYRFAKKEALYSFLGKLLSAFIIVVITWISLIVADDIFRFTSATRWGLLIIHMGLGALLFYFHIFKYWRQFISIKRKGNLSAAAAKIAFQLGDTNGAYANIWQLITSFGNQKSSEELRKMEIERVLGDFETVQMKGLISLQSYIPSFLMIFSALFTFSILFMTNTNLFYYSSLRLLNPSSNYLFIPEYRFEVKPGNVTIYENTPLKISAEYVGPPADNFTIVYRNDDNSHIHEQALTVTKANMLNFHFRSIHNQLKYYIIAKTNKYGHLSSPEYNVNVLHPPKIKNFDIEVTAPAYSGRSIEKLERNSGDILALPQSRVRLNLHSDRVLKKAFLKYDSGKQTALTTKGKRAGGHFTITQNDSYHIMIEDTSGLVNLTPISYRIDLLEDRSPIVEITDPGTDIEGHLDLILPLKIKASDDYGIKELALKYRIKKDITGADSTWKNIELLNLSDAPKSINDDYHFDFSKLPLAFGDELIYYASVRDNRNIVSEKAFGRSRLFYVRFPGLEDIFAEADKTGEEQIKTLEEISQKSDELSKKLDLMKRKLKRDKKVSWEQKKEIEKLTKASFEQMDKIKKIEKKIDEMLERLEKSNLLNDAVLQKYEQLQEMFKNLLTQEQLKNLRKIKENLDKNDARQTIRDINEFEKNQRNLKEQIDRTMELLKQVRLEQKMDELLQQISQLLSEQKKITETLQAKDHLMPLTQKDLDRRMQRQKETLSSLSQKTESLKDDPLLDNFQKVKDQLKKMAEKSVDSNLQQSLEKTQRGIQKNNTQMAAVHSQETEKKLSELRQGFLNSQNTLHKDNKKQLKREMISAMRKALTLSEEQEELQTETENASQLGDELNEIEKKQGQILNNFNKMAAHFVQLSKKTFTIDSKTYQSLHQARLNMQKSLNQLSERSNKSAASSQKNAMAALNGAVKSMQKALGKMSGSQTGSGFEQFMEGMQQMAGAQGGINKGTMELFKNGQGKPGGRMPAFRKSAMQQLAREQHALKQQLEQLREQLGREQTMGGRLGEMGNAMDEIVRDLLKENVSRKTIQRQEQLFKRMLDAQKSMEKRKKSKKRKSQQGKNYYAIDPGALDDGVDLAKQKIRQALKQAQEEAYKKDYQLMIEKYYHLLLKKSEKTIESE
jgi:hypothetical protein